MANDPGPWREEEPGDAASRQPEEAGGWDPVPAPPPLAVPPQMTPHPGAPPPYPPAYQPVPTLDLGRALSRGFRIWARNFLPFSFLGLLIYLPTFAFLLLTYRSAPAPWDPQPTDIEELFAQLGAQLGMGLLQLVLSFILTGAVVYGVVEQMRGRRPGLGDILSVGIARMLPVLGVGLLVGLAVAAGTLACLVPGIILYCMWYVAVPVAVCERVGVTGSMGRSAELTSGSRWMVFALILILFFIGAAVVMPVQFGLVAVVPHTRVGFLLYQLAINLVGVLTSVLGSVMAAVVYSELRRVKEGVDPEDLGEVFA